MMQHSVHEIWASSLLVCEWTYGSTIC